MAVGTAISSKFIETFSLSFEQCGRPRFDREHLTQLTTILPSHGTILYLIESCQLRSRI